MRYGALGIYTLTRFDLSASSNQCRICGLEFVPIYSVSLARTTCIDTLRSMYLPITTWDVITHMPTIAC